MRPTTTSRYTHLSHSLYPGSAARLGKRKREKKIREFLTSCYNHTKVRAGVVSPEIQNEEKPARAFWRRAACNHTGQASTGDDDANLSNPNARGKTIYCTSQHRRRIVLAENFSALVMICNCTPCLARNLQRLYAPRFYLTVVLSNIIFVYSVLYFVLVYSPFTQDTPSSSSLPHPPPSQPPSRPHFPPNTPPPLQHPPPCQPSP